jgi:hypothetical protein
VTTEELELFPGWEPHARLQRAARGERPARERLWGRLMTENVDPDVLSALASVEERGWVLEIDAMRIASAAGARRV